MMKDFLKVALAVVILAVLVLGVLSLREEKKEIESDLLELMGTVAELREENESLKRDIEYFQNEENLIKELKSHFNYKEEGERLIIIAPGGRTEDENGD